MSYDAPPPGNYQGGYGAAPQGNSNKAVWALILGILSLVCCGIIAGIPAIIVGRQAKAEGGGGMAKAGEILGWISIAWTVLAIIVYAVAFASSN